MTTPLALQSKAPLLFFFHFAPQDEKEKSKKAVLYQVPVTCSIRLNNNNLTNLEGFQEVIEKVMDTPKRLSWIDVSFNKLTTIDAALTMYPNLSNLYLHANNITELKEIKKLSKCPNLRMVTLHGNPVVEKKYYRYSINKLYFMHYVFIPYL